MCSVIYRLISLFSILVSKQTGDVCPETHFMCSSVDFCLPMYLMCNNHRDCPGGEDEADCTNYRCPGNKYLCLIPPSLYRLFYIDSSTVLRTDQQANTFYNRSIWSSHILFVCLFLPRKQKCKCSVRLIKFRMFQNFVHKCLGLQMNYSTLMCCCYINHDIIEREMLESEFGVARYAAIYTPRGSTCFIKVKGCYSRFNFHVLDCCQ